MATKETEIVTAKELKEKTKARYANNVNNMQYLGGGKDIGNDKSTVVVFYAKEANLDQVVKASGSNPSGQVQTTSPDSQPAPEPEVKVADISRKIDNLVVNAFNKDAANTVLRNATTVATIALPLPNSLNESLTHEWKTDATSSQSDLANAGIGALDKALGSIGFLETKKALSQGATMSGVKYPVVDPGYFSQYGGTTPRRFSFSWEFVIQTQTEADTIFNIFRNFKKFSSPSKALSNVVLMSPNFWIVDIKNPRLANSMNLQPVVITQVDIDYAGSGVMDMYYDGTPKMVKMTIGFSEIRAVVSEDWI